MIIVIRKQTEDKFVAHVDDPIVTHQSDPNFDALKPFQNGIIAEGNTWGEALENIKKKINKYIDGYKGATGNFPSFTKDGTATIISENTTMDDFLK